MLKHATICRTNRAQQALRMQWSEQLSAGENHDRPCDPIATPDIAPIASIGNNDDLNDNQLSPSLINNNWLMSTRFTTINAAGASCSSSPTPSLQTAPISRFSSLSSAPSSVFNSPSKSSSSICANTTVIKPTVSRSSAESTIKIYAQTLSQEVEYVTLHVNSQTKSQQIIRTLLKKFRLKHRDPNLFYLTLERWIRKDGIKFKSVMLLGDDACPLQLQSCCSNPPHDDIKFTLQMRAGALIKIFCSDVCSNTKYKCLSLSTQTTVDETIELMLHCLNLSTNTDGKRGNNGDTFSRTLCSTAAISHLRQANSPSSTGSSESSSSSTSSSSGIESDLTNKNTCRVQTKSTISGQASRQLDSNSRSSSITSISSSSNLSNTSSSQSLSEHYCLIIECKNTNYRRILESDEYLVDVYQGLLDEALEHPQHSPSIVDGNTNTMRSISSSSMSESIQQPDQWFVIKLKRRDEMSHHSIKFTNPRQNMPLPPIPLSLAQFNNANNLQYIVSTANIEVNSQQRQPISSLATNKTNVRNNFNDIVEKVAVDEPDGQLTPPTISTASSRPINHHQKQMSAIASSSCSKMPPPPASLIWLPPIKPRRRNLSNASSTFGRPQVGLSADFTCNRRRYDPAQLAEDLNQLNLPNSDNNYEVESNNAQTKIVSEPTSRLSTNCDTLIEDSAISGPTELLG